MYLERMPYKYKFILKLFRVHFFTVLFFAERDYTLSIFHFKYCMRNHAVFSRKHAILELRKIKKCRRSRLQSNYDSNVTLPEFSFRSLTTSTYPAISPKCKEQHREQIEPAGVKIVVNEPLNMQTERESAQTLDLNLSESFSTFFEASFNHPPPKVKSPKLARTVTFSHAFAIYDSPSFDS